MEISSANLLWCTRGKNWGFKCLSQCEAIGKRFEILYRKVFDFADQSRMGYRNFCFEFQAQRKYCVTYRCSDFLHRRDDSHGRPIPHDFLLVCNQVEFEAIEKKDWGPAVMRNLEPLYQQYYGLPEGPAVPVPISFELDLSCLPQLTEEGQDFFTVSLGSEHGTDEDDIWADLKELIQDLLQLEPVRDLTRFIKDHQRYFMIAVCALFIWGFASSSKESAKKNATVQNRFSAQEIDAALCAWDRVKKRSGIRTYDVFFPSVQDILRRENTGANSAPWLRQ